MSWYGLLAIGIEQQIEVRAERAIGPMSCPHCGEPLLVAPSHGATRYCKFDGYRWPNDGWGELGEPRIGPIG